MDVENKRLQVVVSTDVGECSHLTTMQCPSPKKGLAHAIVQCNIHLGRIVDPRILPCGHSFCLRCLGTLHQQQQQPISQNQRASPSSNLTKLVCPLCRQENQFESIESLTINFAISDLLEIFDAEEKEEERVRRETLAEMEHTVGILRTLREFCYKKSRAEDCSQLYAAVFQDAVIATEKRLSFLDTLAQEIEDEKDRATKERLVRKLHYVCLAYQRLTETFSGEMQISNGKMNELNPEQAKHYSEMYKSTVVLDYRPSETMSERKSRLWFSIIFSLIPKCWLELENRRFSNAADLLAAEFSKNFDHVDGAWISVVGRRPLGCWIWKDEHDYACLDISDYRLIIYRRCFRREKNSTDANVHKKKSGGGGGNLQRYLEKTLAEAVRMKEEDGWRELNVAKFLREHLQKDFCDYFWHTAAGYKDTFAVSASAQNGSTDLEVRTVQGSKWRALVWEG